jgi:hypothetical protein
LKGKPDWPEGQERELSSQHLANCQAQFSIRAKGIAMICDADTSAKSY